MVRLGFRVVVSSAIVAGCVSASSGSRSLSSPHAIEFRRACDGESARACHALAELVAGTDLARLDGITSESRGEALDLTNEACDRGFARACYVLARIHLFEHRLFPTMPEMQHLLVSGTFRPRSVPLGLQAWEKGCRYDYREYSGNGTMECVALRAFLIHPRAPRRDRDDWLPFFSEHRGGPVQSGPSPGRGICDVDPTVCPSSSAVASPADLERLAQAPREYANAMASFQAACARGDHHVCFRFVELQELRWDTQLTVDERSRSSADRCDGELPSALRRARR